MLNLARKISAQRWTSANEVERLFRNPRL